MRAAFAASLALALLAGCTTPDPAADAPQDPDPAPQMPDAVAATPTPLEVGCDLPLTASALTTAACSPGQVQPDAGSFTTGTATLSGQPGAVPATFEVVDGAGNVLAQGEGALPLTVTLQVPTGAFTPQARVTHGPATVLAEGAVAFRFA